MDFDGWRRRGRACKSIPVDVLRETYQYNETCHDTNKGRTDV